MTTLTRQEIEAAAQLRTGVTRARCCLPYPTAFRQKTSRVRMVFSKPSASHLGQSEDGSFRGVSRVSLQIQPATVGLRRVYTNRAVAGNDGRRCTHGCG